jgi:hypothetical protein
MRSHVLRAASLAFLLAGCATHSTTQPPPRQNAYEKPLTSPGAKFGALPLVVQRTVLAEAGLAQVVDAVRDTSAGRVVYKIYFRESDAFPPMFVAPDGSVLNPDLTVAVNALHGSRVKLGDLPPVVVKAISAHAHDAEVDYINKEMWGSRLVYAVTFKDEAHHPRLFLAEDGTVLEETQ